MMDVIFEASTEGRIFTIEIWFFDTVLEIKEKIQKHEGYPVSRQTLVINGNVMEDDRDTEYYGVLQGSRLHLLLEPPPDSGSGGGKPAVKVEEESSAPAPAAPHAKAVVRVLVRNPPSRRQFALEADVNDTTARLKEMIHEVEGGVPPSRFVLLMGSVELQDHRALVDYGICDCSEVNVVPRSSPLPPAMAAAVGTSNKKLKVMVLPKCGTKKIPVEVNASDNVSELRKELQRLHNHLHFHLPTEGYFFIYKQNVMDEDRPFRWHDVHQGDTIEIFNGSVTGGS